MATEHLTIRIDADLVRQVKELADRQDRSASYIISMLLEESLRMRRYPGIAFADGAGGRRAILAGTGLGLYEVIQVWKAYKKDRKAVLKHLSHIAPQQLDTALAYYKQFAFEIDQEIAQNTPRAEELIERYPFIKRVQVKAR